MKIYTLEDLIKDLGEIPYCQCDSNEGMSCGQKVNVDPRRYMFYKKHGYPQYIYEHRNVKGIKNGMFGKKHKPETIEKMKQSSPHLSKEDHWNYRNITPEKTKKKISKSTKEFYEKHPEVLEHLSRIRTGKNCGERNSSTNIEVQDKISKTLKEYYSLHPEAIKRGEEHPQFGKKGNLSPLFGRPSPRGAGWGNGNYHLTPNQGIVWMNSQWEIKYALYLEQNDIDYYYEFYVFEMNIGYDTTYRPDFYLPKTNKFIEIKGRDNYSKWEDCNGKLKSNKFKKEFCEEFEYEVLFGSDLISLGIDLNNRLTKGS